MRKITITKKVKLQDGITTDPPKSKYDVDRLSKKSVKDIIETIASQGKMDETALVEFQKGLKSKGYPYKFEITKTPEGGLSTQALREVMGVSKNYNKAADLYHYGINYKDGSYSTLPGEKEFLEEMEKVNQSKVAKTPYLRPITPDDDVYSKEPQLRQGIDTTTRNANTASAIGAGGEILGSTIDAIDVQEDGKKSVAGATAKGAVSGAAMGATIGGPWGAAIGGVVGGAAGGISTAVANKKIEAKIKEKLVLEQKAMAMRNMQPAQNTQSPIYEFGTAGANMTKPVEVEKDEVVLRKNALGKFTLAADFKGGKTHNQGGEDYVLKQGDIVFPGKKRSTIMKSLNNGDHARIESERMKLPKELPGSDKLQNGIAGIPTKNSPTFVQEKEYYPWDAEGKLTTPADILYPKTSKVEQTVPKYMQPLEGANSLPASWKQKIMDNTLRAQDKKVPKPVSKALKQVMTETDPIRKGIDSITLNEDSKSKFNQFSLPDTKTLKTIENKPFNQKEFDADYKANKAAQAAIKKAQSEEGTGFTDRNSGMLDALKYAPAAANMIRGMQKPEKVSRRFLSPEQVRYKDSSEGIRKEIDTQAKIDADNASRFSGGSAQVARAGKAMAGTSRFKRMQSVNQGEQQRADQITQFNTQTRNQTKGINLDLANRYDEMDAQNKAAVDAYFNRGAADFGRITNQISRDRGMEKTQDVALKMLESGNFTYNKKTGKLELIKPTE